MGLSSGLSFPGAAPFTNNCLLKTVLSGAAVVRTCPPSIKALMSAVSRPSNCFGSITCSDSPATSFLVTKLSSSVFLKRLIA